METILERGAWKAREVASSVRGDSRESSRNILKLHESERIYLTKMVFTEDHGKHQFDMRRIRVIDIPSAPQGGNLLNTVIRGTQRIFRKLNLQG